MTTSSKLPMPKWCLIGLATTPAAVFILTMWICTHIVQQRGNMIWDNRYMLNDSVLNNDISAYGVDSPEHSIFATGFTVLSLALSSLMYFRHALWKHYLGPQGYCSFNFIVMLVGWMHAPPLIMMGWTDGKQSQRVHFPAAMLGLGILHIYCILNFFLSIQVLRKATSSLSQRQKTCLGLEVCFLTVISIFVPVCIMKWILLGQAWYEWMAVFLLLSSTIPGVLNFWAVPDDLCAVYGRNASHIDEAQLQSAREDPLLNGDQQPRQVFEFS